MAIGVSSFGLVWRAHVFDKDCPHNMEKVAIKIIQLDSFSKHHQMGDLRKEINIISKCNHPNVLKYYVSFLDGKELWLVMPYIEGGSLKNIINTLAPTGIKDEPMIASILKQIVEGMQYFHSKGLIHRDIKSDNLLVNKNGEVMLSDFGVSSSIKTGYKRTSFVGSPCWMAPEVIEQTTGYDTKADIWSFGITALEMVDGKPPHNELPAVKVLVMVLNGPNPGLSKYEDWSPEFRSMMDDCLQKDPQKRIGINNLLTKHKAFFNKSLGKQYVKDLLLKHLPPMNDIIPKQIVAAGEEYFDRKYQLQAQKLGFSFGGNTTFKKKKEVNWNFESVDYGNS